MIDLATETKIGGVRARLTKRQRQLPSRERLRLSAFVRAVAHVAAANRRRWLRPQSIRGLDKIPGRTIRGRYVISRRYARKMGMDRNWFRSREEFLSQKPKRIPYYNTGGMWGNAPPDQYGRTGGGMQVRGSGRSGAIIDFYGRSVGSSSTNGGVYKSGKRKGQTKWSGKVSNALKAGTVKKHTGNNLTVPTDEQMEDLIQYVVAAVTEDVYVQFGAPVDKGGRVVRIRYNDRKLGADLERLRR